VVGGEGDIFGLVIYVGCNEGIVFFFVGLV